MLFTLKLLQSVLLDRVFLFKYFRVLISHYLCWSAHISVIAARSKKVIELIIGSFTISAIQLPLEGYTWHLSDQFLSIAVLSGTISEQGHQIAWIHAKFSNLEGMCKVMTWVIQLLVKLKERRAVLKFTVVYKCLKGLTVLAPNT